MYALQQAQRQRQAAALAEANANANAVAAAMDLTDEFDINELRHLNLDDQLNHSSHHYSNAALRGSGGPDDDEHLKSVVSAALEGEDFDHRLSGPFGRGNNSPPPFRPKFSPPPRASSTPPTQSHFRQHSLNFSQEFHGDLTHADLLYNMKNNNMDGSVSLHILYIYICTYTSFVCEFCRACLYIYIFMYIYLHTRLID